MNGIEQHLPALQVVVPMLSAAVVMLLKPRGLAWAASTADESLCFRYRRDHDPGDARG